MPDTVAEAHKQVRQNRIGSRDRRTFGPQRHLDRITAFTHRGFISGEGQNTRNSLGNAQMLTIDGSHGEGGGQIVRSSLALSLVTGRAIAIENIRARRKRAGLLQQHLTALRAAAEISDAVVTGDTLGASRLTFQPGPVRGGRYSFRLGTAGSTTLVLQTILPALMIADTPSSIFLEGGTHNPFAPPFEFLERSYLPLLIHMGPKVDATLTKHGFYPAGGGRMQAKVTPCSELAPLRLVDAEKIRKRKVRALVAHLPEHVAARECRTAIGRLGWDESCGAIATVSDSEGPGNVLMVEIERRNVTELFTGFGEKGVRAEKVASKTAARVQRYLKANVPVGEHLADQLLLPLGLAAHRGARGGQFRTHELSSHSRTHIDVLRAFLSIAVTVDVRTRDDVRVSMEPSPRSKGSRS